MTAPSNGIIHEQTLGKLSLGFRSITLDDLVQYSKKIDWCGKVFTAIKLFFSGKGLLTNAAVHHLLQDHPDCENIVKNYPELKRLFNINTIAIEKLVQPEEIKKENPKPLVLLPIAENKELQKQAEQTKKVVEQLMPEPQVKEAPKVHAKPVLKIEELQENEKELVANAWRDLELKSQALHYRTFPDLYCPYNEKKDRFMDILCPKATAVPIKNADGQDGYVNANHVGKAVNASQVFVAAQAPLASTCEDFWKAVNTECDLILDLSNQADRNGRYPVIEYGPLNISETIVYGEMDVTLKEVVDLDDPTIYKYELKQGNGPVKLVERIHFSSWPDNSVITVKELDYLIDGFDGGAYKDKKLLVHCRAGVGRTGVFITAAILKQKVASGEITKDNFGAQIPEIIYALRTERGPIFVQTKGQFALLYDYTKLLLNTQK